MATIIQVSDVTGLSISKIISGLEDKYYLRLIITDSSGDTLDIELFSEHASVLKTLNPNNQASITQR